MPFTDYLRLIPDLPLDLHDTSRLDSEIRKTGKPPRELFKLVLKDFYNRCEESSAISGLERAFSELSIEIQRGIESTKKRKEILQLYSRFLRKGDKSEERILLEKIGLRYSDQKHIVNGFSLIRRTQLRNFRDSARRSTYSKLFSCFNLSAAEKGWRDLIQNKEFFADTELIKGAFIARPFSVLINEAIILKPSDSPYLEALNWNDLRKRTILFFALTRDAIFVINMIYDYTIMIAHSETPISNLLEDLRNFKLIWAPQDEFPVKFRLKRLLRLIQRMVIQSFM